MQETPSLICRTWEVVKQIGEFFNHCVIVRCIVAGNREDLHVSSELIMPYPQDKLLTLSLIPKSSRILVNAAAKLRPECERVSSMMSRSIAIGTPSFSKWTITAMYALWLEDVHASIAKFSAPVCSCSD